MKKRIWMLAWLFCITAAFGMYVYTAVTEAARPPASGWSRSQVLTVLNGLTAYDLRNNEGIALKVCLDKADVLYQDPTEGLKQFTIDASGGLTEARVLDAGFEPADTLFVYREDSIWKLVALQGHVINHYRLDNDGLTKIDGEGPSDIKRFDVYNGQSVAITGSAVLVETKKDGVVKRIEGIFQFVRWIPDQGSKISAIAEKDGRRLLQFWDVSQEPILLSEWSVPADAQTAVESLTPYGDKNTTAALVELKDFKTGRVRLVDYRLNPARQEKEVLSASGDLNPVSLGVENGVVKLLLSQEQKKGDDETVWNIRQGTWDGQTLTKENYVTQTEASSIPIKGWRMGAYHYVLSADISGDTKKLMLSGNSPELVKRTASLGSSEMAEFLPSIIMTLLPSLMVGLFPMVYIIVPVLLVLFLVTLFKLSWAEKNYKGLIRYATVAHILLKIFFAFRWVLFNGNIPNISAQLPWYLNSPGAMLVTLALSTAAAWFTARLRNSETAQGDFWGPYGSFALMDLSIFVLLVMPYYYAYVGLPVFLR